MSDLITNNLDFGTGDNYVLQDARVDSMYTNAQIDSALGNKVDKVSGKGLSTEDFTTAYKTKLTNLTRPNNSTITIRQGGVVKGTFTVDSAQDITIDIDAGGGSVDAYTKTESDNRFASKTYFDKDKIDIDNTTYNVQIGYDNSISANAEQAITIGRFNNVNTNAGRGYGSILIGSGNEAVNNSGDDNICIGYHCETSTSSNVVLIGSAWGSLATGDEVLIGYHDKAMSVKSSGEVYSRGDVTCDDGSGGRISLRNLKTSLNNKNIEYYQLILGQTITDTATVYTLYGGRKLSDYDLLIFQLGTSVNDVRDTKIIPRNIWSSGYSLKMVVLHGGSSGSASNWNVGDATITYNSDTSIKAVVGGSKAINVLRVYGIKLG